MSKNLTWLGTLTTMAVSFICGTVLFQPVSNVTGLDIVSSGILVALCAEGVMRHIIFMSDSPSGFRKFATAWMLRDPSILTKDDDKKSG